MQYCLSEDLWLTEPPLAEYSDYFTEGKVHGKLNVPAEIINFEITILGLIEYPNLKDQKGLDYIVKFLNHFCPQGDHYKMLSKEGIERVDSIFNSDSVFIQKAVHISKCHE